MGSVVGARKAAARRVGLTLTEYDARVLAGLKWCIGCKDWHPVEDFAVDRSRGDGRMPTCFDARRARYRATYVPSPRPEPGRRYAEARDGDTKQARGRVNYLITAGLLPAPNGVPCVDCGHVWAPGKCRHEYDHHLGYAAEHHEDVEAVCMYCHHARTQRRKRAA